MPGVYLMKDARGAVLYVGKANNLRSRVRSYFRKDTKARYQIGALLRRLADIEVVVTDTEKEALLLEHTLIRRHRPRYNIFFRDDKTYMSVKVNLAHPSPGIFRTRRVQKDDAAYFGPYPSSAACRETIEMVTRHFRIRTCSDREFANRSRPCIQYQIGRCTAPCVGLVDPARYRAQVDQALLLLRGEKNALTAHLQQTMRAAAAEERFEEAARARDVLADIAETVEPQKMVRHAAIDRDYVGFAVEGERAGVAVLTVRDGKVVEHRGAVVIQTADACDVIESFLLQYYHPPRRPPREVCVPCQTAPFALLVRYLEDQRGGPVALLWPRRGTEAKLLKLAQVNARALCRSAATAQEEWETLCEQIRRALHLPRLPHVIECVDISNWQGKQAVGSLVAFAGGVAAKERYRHFRIRGPALPNDYAMMHEVLARRMTGRAALALPDLLLVDGGRGQLQVALRALEAAGIVDLACAAIAKAREDEETDKIYLPNRKNPLPLRKGDPVLLFLQRVRDEAHRFAISHQRRRQQKRMTSRG